MHRKLLLTEDIPCLAVRTRSCDARAGNPYHGLFDVWFHETIPRVLLNLVQYADVNAFLTLAATRHTFLPDDSRGNQRLHDIVTAAKAGRVPVHLVSSTLSFLLPLHHRQGFTVIFIFRVDLSDKNPIEILPHDATAISLLEVFARGAHRGEHQFCM